MYRKRPVYDVKYVKRDIYISKETYLYGDIPIHNVKYVKIDI